MSSSDHELHRRAWAFDLMLGKLLILRKVMAAKGGRLILCEIDPDIECVFVETKLTHIFEIMDMEADALDACK